MIYDAPLLLNSFALIILLILAFIFYGKERMHKTEDSLYGFLLITTIITMILGLVLGVILKFEILHKDLLIIIFNKAYLIGLLFIVSIFSFYTFCISRFYKQENNHTSFYLAILVILFLIILFLPVKITYGNNLITVGGPATIITFAIYGLEFVFLSVLMMIDIKKIKSKKYIPVIVLIAEGLVMTVVQYFFPSINFLINPSIVVVCLIMYFTIENPDIRIIELEKQAAESAKAASEAKTAFLSSMSHELRTPLNAIVGLSEDITAYKDQVPEEVREDSEDIVNAADTLLEIVGNILDINKIEGGKLELIETDYNPKHEFESIVKIMRTKIKEKPLEFNTYIDEGLPEALFGDRLRIKQVINNFLSNAIKYTDEGKIDFSVRWISAIDTLQIIVSDTGRGVKSEDMDKLFEKFERLHVEKTSSVQGTGLGLSITKSLVELMNGQIHVESVYGKGSTFSVTIPQKIGDASKLEKLDTEKQTRLNTDYSGKKVLVVDDNSLNIKVLNKALKPFNFEIDECFDGKSAIDKINKNNYDVVFMDIMMPGMGGEEALSILKQNPDFHTPVVALTADATTGAKEKYLADGFTDYLAKPFTRDIIAQKLEKILK